MRLAWAEFILWMEDNLEATAMIKTFVDEVNIIIYDFESTEF